MIDSNVRALRKALDKSKKVDAGTVVKFTALLGETTREVGRTYTYAALWIGGQWYVTGFGTAFDRSYSYEQFISEVLGAESVIDAYVATEWENLK